jgi:hypothetical protein
MPEESKKAEPRYAIGEDVILRNTWALQVQEGGLPAKVTGIRPGPKGKIIYTVNANRPPVPVSVEESDLGK